MKIGEQLEIMDFSATWCGPCRMLAPILEELEQELGGRIKVSTIDVDENPDLAMQYDIMSVPTIIFRDIDGQVLRRTVGMMPKRQLLKLVTELGY